MADFNRIKKKLKGKKPAWLKRDDERIRKNCKKIKKIVGGK